jgi:hypothetical protein
VDRFGAWVTGGFLVLGSMVLPGPLAPSPACAGEGPRAVLVVDTGESESSLCVGLPEPSVSGLELIELAGEQHGLSYRFGYGGNAVCMLAGVGATGDDCFEKYPDFWGYWRGDGTGGWSWSGSGAGSTTVEDGDVEGWSWGSGNNGDTHPRPPDTNFEDVCAQQAQPSPSSPKPGNDDGDDGQKQRNEPDRSGGRSPSSGDAGRAAPTSRPSRDASPGTKGDDKRQRGPDHPRKRGDERRKRDEEKRKGNAATRATIPTPSPTSALTKVQPDALEPTASPGPPMTGLAALAAAAALGGAGVMLARRRRASGS